MSETHPTAEQDMPKYDMPLRPEEKDALYDQAAEIMQMDDRHPIPAIEATDQMIRVNGVEMYRNKLKSSIEIDDSKTEDLEEPRFHDSFVTYDLMHKTKQGGSIRETMVYSADKDGNAQHMAYTVFTFVGER